MYPSKRENEYFGVDFQFRSKHEWILPSGFDTGIKVYNIQLKKTVPLIFPNENLVKWYICGPTVYDTSHIGHASCYIRFDIIRRILKQYFNIRPVVGISITDVADLIAQKANASNEPYKALAKRYEIEFFNQMEHLNVIPPDFTLRVSEYINEIIKFIEILLLKKAAYQSSDGCVYYDTKNDINYGRLLNPRKHGSAKLKETKKYVLDFALWKSVKGSEMYWESPWGKGKPGWHIECSAMSSFVFGGKLDMHSGGSDLIFPHHENEEAQSCSYHSCKQWVNYWLHAGLLHLNQEKMSKSLMNFIPIEEFLKTYKSDHLRIFCLMSHYRKDLYYSTDSIQLAINTYDKIISFLEISELYIRGSWMLGNVNESQLLEDLERTKKNMNKFMADDFDTPGCYRLMMDLIKKASQMINENNEKSIGRSPAAVAAVNHYVKDFFKSLGFRLGERTSNVSFIQRMSLFYVGHRIEMTEDILKLETVVDAAVNFRSRVRTAALSLKDKELRREFLEICDSARENFNTFGITVKDQGPLKSAWSSRER